jgi:hypothetical protein
MAQFMLILHETPGSYAKLSPEEIQRVIEKYNAWSGKLAASGKLLGGHKLKEEGGKQVARAKDRLSVVDGPYTETKEVVGGIFLIEAGDYDEAVRLTSDCPHLAYGRIDVRQIDPMVRPKAGG